MLVAGLLIVFALPYEHPLKTASRDVSRRCGAAPGLGVREFQIFKAAARWRLSYAVLSARVWRDVVGEPARCRGGTDGASRPSCNTSVRWKRGLDGELNAARAIQIGLLPRDFPGRPERRDVEVFASIEPARMVGGDLYDFVLLDRYRLSFAIADVSGKGVPAALFMAMTKEVLHTATLSYRNALDPCSARRSQI